MKTNKAEFETLVEQCFSELSTASKEKYDAEKAEKTAALFLAAQMQLAYFVEDIELKAKHSKTDIERIEGERYFQIKGASDKKITEATLSQHLAKDEAVLDVKRCNNEAEAEMRKYNYLMSSLKDGHIFFRSLAKDKNGWTG